MRFSWVILGCLSAIQAIAQPFQLVWEPMSPSVSYSVYESVTNAPYVLLGATTNSYWDLGERTESLYHWKIVSGSQVLELSLAPPPNPTPTTSTNLILNGSFELGSTNWTVSGNAVAMKGSWLSSTGNWAMVFHLNSQPANGVVSQSITTTNGGVYSITFDVAAASFSNQELQTVRVTAIGLTTLADQSFSVRPIGFGTKYVSESFTFIGDGSLTSISFYDLCSIVQNIDMCLDNVQVVRSQ